MSTFSNSRIIRNTLFLFFRLGITIIVNFYIVRLLLKNIGLSEFGIYTVIGGVVALFNALRGLFSSAVQRFLNFELGQGDSGRMRDVFITSLQIHFALAFLIVLLVDPGTTYFVNTMMSFGDGRLPAANWVLQFSFLTVVISVLTLPFEATIIAYEKMHVLVIFQCLQDLLTLAAALVLPYCAGDKLILYAVLVFCANLVANSGMIFYCRGRFPEVCGFSFHLDRGMFRQLSSFALWNFLGNATYSLRNQGVDVLINMFMGPSANGVCGFAYEARTAINKLISNAMLAANPQITQLYSGGNRQLFYQLIFRTTKLNFLLVSMIGIPLFFSLRFLLRFWLGDYPFELESLIRLVVLYLFVRSMIPPINSFFNALGNIRMFQIIMAVFNLLMFLLSYLTLKLGGGLSAVFWVPPVMTFIQIFALLIWMHRLDPEFPIWRYINGLLLRQVLLSVCFLAIPLLGNRYFVPETLISCLLSSLVIGGLVFAGGALLFSRSERQELLAYCKSLLNKVRN